MGSGDGSRVAESGDLSEISQSKEDKYYMISLIGDIY